MALRAGFRVGLLFACTLTTAAAPDAGWEAYSAGRSTEAIVLWTQAAAGGDAEAAFGLGVAYDLGQGVIQDEALACLWYRRAGEAGITAAAFNTAVMLDQGRCGKRDPALVAAWYGRAAAAGHARAEYDLAQLYDDGDGLPHNPDQALAWYRLAAASGLSAAADRVSVLSQSRHVSTAALQAVTPTAPVNETVPDRGQPVAFVWSAPVQPGPVRFFLELYALSADGAQEVLARYVDESATRVTLQPGTAQYAWRVATVFLSDHRYVEGDWTRFQVTGRVSR